jgi:hypothetical protein
MISFNDLRNNKYTEEELEKHINDFTKRHWSYISCYQTLSEPFIERYKDKLNWRWISRDQKLSETFIEKHSKKVVWGFISEYQKLSENFLLNNLEYIDIDWLEENKHIPKELIEKVKFMKDIQS